MSDNKIIDLNATPAAPAQPARLSHKTANELAGALQRWTELRNAKIKTPTTDAELAGLTEYMATTLITHSSDLLGAWFVVRAEYEPLIGVLTNIKARLDAVCQRPCGADCDCHQTKPS